MAVCDFLYSKAPNCSEGMYFNEDDYFTDAEIQDNDTMTELNGEIDHSIPTPLLKKWIEDVNFQGSQNCPSFQKITCEEFHSPETRKRREGKRIIFTSRL